jgi:hypothetical protein
MEEHGNLLLYYGNTLFQVMMKFENGSNNKRLSDSIVHKNQFFSSKSPYVKEKSSHITQIQQQANFNQAI